MAAVARELLIIHGEKPSENDAALHALADFLGLDSRFSTFVPPDWGPPNRGRLHTAISGETLAGAMRCGLMERLLDFLGEQASSLLIYGVESEPSVVAGLARLTAGLIKGVKHPDSIRHTYEVGRETRDICGQLSGLKIGPVESRVDHVFVLSEGQGPSETLISIDGKPFFIMARTERYPIFLAGASSVANVRASVSGPIEAAGVFSRLLPAAIYLKSVFGTAIWHQEQSRACLVIDDPLLKERYGFLDFRKLADLMDTFDFASSIGFIPWNFRRTSRNTAALFNAKRDRFSLCVHGCNHTRHEFGSLDRNYLNAIIGIASDRMEHHRRVTGVNFDRVMVFPQGVFSTCAMEALKSNNYLAAVNMDVFPVNSSGSLQMKAFLEPAITAFGDFPLFLRREPEQLSDIAMDLFWGRPALIMVHHDFFKDGYRSVIDTATRINAIDGRIEWCSPGDIIKRSHLSREEPGGTIRIKSYVAEIVIENPTGQRKDYIVSKKESVPPVMVALSSGKKAVCERRDGEFCLALTVEPYGRESVTLVYAKGRPPILAGGGFRNAMAVRMRRYLSEIRDNYLGRNETLLSLAMKLKDRLLR
jgi:hypothetical protein